MSRSGFTLIELLVTLAIIATLAMLAAPVAQTAAQRAREAELRHALRDIRTALDAYKKASDEGRIRKANGESGYPKTLEQLVEGVEDSKDPKKNKIYFLRKLPRDPMSENNTASDAATWGKRSYASEPDNPQEGDDVFDVYSLSTSKGLNNLPYRKW